MFKWSYFNDKHYPSWEIIKSIDSSRVITSSLGESEYPAYSCAELGEILPARLNLKEASEAVYLYSLKFPDKFEVFYRDFDTWISFHDKNEANARSKMLIHLIENKLMELPNEIT